MGSNEMVNGGLEVVSNEMVNGEVGGGRIRSEGTGVEREICHRVT